jgi:hypothetical protein
MQDAGGVQAVLHPVADHREVGVGHVQVGIDPEGDGEELCPVRLVAVEEIAVIEIPVGAGIGDGIGSLVDREVVGLGEHGRSSGWPLEMPSLVVSLATLARPAVSSERR